jgi:hypothetical protein
MSDPGPLFRLSRNPSAASVSLRWKAGEIWLDSGDRGEATGRSAPLPSGLSARPERITSVPDDSDAVDLPRSSDARPAATAHVMHDLTSHDEDRPVLIATPSRAPLSIQQRI